jgi:aminoglycoside phosphotransferase (APT) family kinase protein
MSVVSETRQERFSGTREVHPRLAFDEARLARYLADRIDDFRPPMTVRQVKGGQSNPTYLIETGRADYVLRRKPPGKLLPSAHAVDREYRVMKALGAAGFPVPRVYLLCEDASVIGTAFYLMAKVDGRIIWDPAMPDVDRSERAAVYDRMNATIAELHSYDPAALGLADFGRPTGYVRRQIARWSKQYQASQTEPIADMDRLIAWLPDHLPPENEARVVHGDYRLDNMILAADGPDVKAVLDWELSTLGDPVADFTYHAMLWRMPKTEMGSGSLIGEDLAALGIPSLDAYVADYERRTGLGVAEHLDFYFAYNFFRLAAIIQGIVGRVRDGTATSKTPYTVATVKPLAAAAWSFAARMPPSAAAGTQ